MGEPSFVEGGLLFYHKRGVPVWTKRWLFSISFLTNVTGTNRSPDGDKPNQVSYASNTFTVGNTPGASLPATGGPGSTLYYAGGAALLLLAIAMLLFRKRADGE